MINKKIRAYSVQSIMLASIIMGILGVGAYSFIWPSIDLAKEVSISSHLKKQANLLLLDKKTNYLSIRNSVSLYGNSDGNYIDELVTNQYLDDIPLRIFSSPSDLIWKIIKETNAIGEDTYKIEISSLSANDSKLINNAKIKASLPLFIYK